MDSSQTRDQTLKQDAEEEKEEDDFPEAKKNEDDEDLELDGGKGKEAGGTALTWASATSASEKMKKSPEAMDLFDFAKTSRRTLNKAVAEAGKPSVSMARLRREIAGGREGRMMADAVDIPPRRKGGPTAQAQTVRDYIWSTKSTARTQLLASIAEAESSKIAQQLEEEQRTNEDLEEQLASHKDAFKSFLSHHYKNVTDTLARGEEALRTLKEQELRIAYFEGLLKEVQTVQEEEEERLEELTAFQQFLHSITPERANRETLQRLLQVAQGRSGGDRPSVAAVGSETNTNPSTSRLDVSLNESFAASVVKQDTKEEVEGEEKEKEEEKDVEEDDENDVENDFISILADDQLRLLQHRQQEPGRQQKKAELTEGDAPDSDGEDACNDTMEALLCDEQHVSRLSRFYECQCHALLGYLTRLQNRKEALDEDLERRRKKLSQRLEDLEAQKEKETVGPGLGGSELQDVKRLIRAWPGLSGDSEAKEMLDQLTVQVSRVVRDIFGSEKDKKDGVTTEKVATNIQTGKDGGSHRPGSHGRGASGGSSSGARRREAKESSVPGGGGGGGGEGEGTDGGAASNQGPAKKSIDTTRKDADAEEDDEEKFLEDEDEALDPDDVASMGQGALLALLEARVTDLCAQLDLIDPSIRDEVFMKCEKERRARRHEERRRELERRREQRKQKHLVRALAPPPPRVY
ncbi:uncharacterized protein LOC143024515 [Oratosquilla oratoria]|uniref:uncharacterized protein LOC143024515 n=1 Tax=Oratosquilla oratoria TaxID=337810 RepID=UPI003F769B9D